MQRAVPFARNNDGLTLAVFLHASVGVLCDGKEVRFQVTLSPAAVSLYDFWTVKGDALEGIDCNKDYAAVGVDAVLRITVSNGMKD